MNDGKYVFSQVTGFLPANDFIRCIKKFNGNYQIKHFTCWHQMMCMLFGQLGNRESLSDLVVCLQSQRSKWYHLGMGSGLSKSNLAYANENRDWRIFAEFAYIMIARARSICIDTTEFDLDVQGNVYAIDSTTIDLCLRVFWWASFRKNKGAVKLHTQFDIKTDIPSFIHLSDGLHHDVNFIDQVDLEYKAFYIMDRAYISFQRFNRIHQAGAYFVTRMQVNQDYRRLYSHATDKAKGILCDQTIRMNNFYPSRYFKDHLRRIKFCDPHTGKKLEFLTNNFELTALDIATLYKYRWKIELFFKWIKQHLKIKTFWGYSENAVRIQVYCAIIAYTTVAIIKQQYKLRHSTYEILQILSLTLLNKTPLNELFKESYLQTVKELEHKQLNMF